MSEELQTLGEWRKRAVVLFGEESGAVAFLDEKIAENGEDDMVIAESSQMLFVLFDQTERATEVKG